MTKPRDIVRAAMRVTGSSKAFIVGRRRFQEANEIRAAISVVGSWRGLTYSAIGRAINRDHSTISHHVHKHTGADRSRHVIQLAATIDQYLRKQAWSTRSRGESNARSPY